MKELYNHTPSELLNLYVDGELPASMEPHLFSQLSQNEGLQSEMRDLLSIRNAVQNDTESFTPPVAAHRGIFDYLGYTYPGGVAPVAVQTISKFHAFVSKTWLPVLSAVIASLITTVVVNDVINNENTTAESASKNIPVVSSFEDSSPDNSSPDNSSLDNSLLDNSSLENNSTADAIPNATGGTNNSGSESNVAAVETGQSAQVITSDDISSNKISSNKISSDKISPNQISVNSFSIASIGNSSFAGSGNRASMFTPASGGQIMPAGQSINISNGFADSFLPYEAKGYRVMARFNNARSTGAGSDLATHNIGQFSALENFSIGFIAGGGDLKFGVEVGQEAFAQSFRSENGGILYNVEQNPLIFWGAILARYENENFKVYDIQPFVQLSAGGSELGPLGRGIIGLQYITPQAFYGTKLGIQLGYESALLMYQNLNKWNSSEKNGFNLGMSLHF